MAPDPLSALAGPGAARVHGSAIAVGRAGLLILGPSGSGKSGLMLELIALGAAAISDDAVCVSPDGILSAPSEWPGQVELRGLGLIPVAAGAAAPCRCVLDLGAPPETERMPQRREVTVMGRRIPLLHASRHSAWVAGLSTYLRAMDEGRLT